MSAPNSSSPARPRASAGDPPPYAWLDDPAQPFGPVGITTTIVLGSALGAMGLFGLAYGVLGGDQARGARLGVGIAFVVIGAVIVRMGTARRAWRHRNPGVDPLVAAVESGANVGSAFGNQSRVGRFGRWLLYSTDPTLDNDGGLTPAFLQYNAPYNIATLTGTAHRKALASSARTGERLGRRCAG